MNHMIQKGATAVFIIFAATFLANASGVYAAGTNLVPNGNFETAASGGSLLPQSWTTDTWGTLNPTFTYPVAGNSSSKAAQIRVASYTSGDAKWVFDHIPVTAGTVYTYSDTYIGTVPTEIDIEYTSNTGTLSYAYLGDAPATGAAWGTFSANFTPPANTVSVSVLHLIGAAGTLTLDNVSVTAESTVPPPPPPAQKPTIASFTASPSTITAGQSSTLAWNISNASSTSISAIGIVTGSSKSVSPTQTTQYTIMAVNPAGSVIATTTVTVTQAPPPAALITATASRSLSGNPPSNTLDTNPATIWNAGTSATQWIEFNLGSSKPLYGISLSVQQNPAGLTTHQIYAGATPNPTTLVYTFSGNTKTGDILHTSFSPALPNVRYVRVVTTKSPSWVAWGTVTFDASSTTPLPPPPTSGNLISNGGLESGTGATPTGWHNDYWGSLTPVFTYPVAGYNSPRAAKVTVTNWQSGDAKWWFDHVPVSDSTVYTFTDDYLSTAITNLTAEFKMSNGTYQYQWVANAPVAGGTAGGNVSAQITVPKGAVSMTMLHALTSNGSLTIDNASLTALPANPFPTGMVTLTFDDGLASQYTNARPILNTAGFKATYGIITQAVKDINGDPAAMTWAQITQLKNDGNDIGGHTRTHADLTALTSAQAQTEIKGSYDDLVAKGFAPKSFIYPLGAVNSAIEQLVQTAGFTVARGSYWGMNTPTADKYALYDMRLDKTTTIAQAKAEIDQAFADKRWLVLELHDVLSSSSDTYAITPAFLQELVNYIKLKGIKVVTLQEGRALMQ